MIDTRGEEKYQDTSMSLIRIDCSGAFDVFDDLEKIINFGINASIQTVNKWYEIDSPEDGVLIFKIFEKNEPIELSQQIRIIV